MEMYLKSAEAKLMQTLGNMGEHGAGWQGIHFHLNNLLEEYQSEYQVKIAFNLIYDLLKPFEGGIFLLLDHSIIVMCYALDKQLLDKLVFQLRYLYMDDPLAYNESGQENPEFCRIYDLKKQWREFYEVSAGRMGQFARKTGLPDYKPALDIKPENKLENKMEANTLGSSIIVPERNYPRLSSEKTIMPDTAVHQMETVDTKSETLPKPLGRDAFSAARLVNIERDIMHADIQRCIRRQPVCALPQGGKVRRVFDELYIHIAHLRQLLCSEVDFLSNRWLFKYLTYTLDERVIHIIRRTPDRFLNVPISLNLNVESLLSSWFAEFDAAIRPASKVSIVIEVPIVDVFADMSAFMLARAEVQKLGYRICLDGLTTASFASINREKLGVDLVKLQWNADAEGDLSTTENRELAKAVQSTGTNRVILCRCDNKSAVEYGQGMGISLFQGRYLDGLVNPAAKVIN